MKQIVVFLMAAISLVGVKSQNINVQNANNYLNNGQLDKAKTNIDGACLDADTKDKAKTWLYKGNIYLAIHVTNNVTTQPGVIIGSTKEAVMKKLGKPLCDSVLANNLNKLMYNDESKYKLNLFFENGKLKYYTKDGKYKNLDENSIEIAYQAFQKAFELDTKKEYTDQLNIKLVICGSSFFDKGAVLYNNKKYTEAIDFFDRTAKINAMIGYTDTLATYYAALSAELSNQPAKAKDYYNKLIKAGYQKPAVYAALANIYKNEKDSTAANRILKKGLETFPNNYDLLIAQTNIYLGFGQSKKALDNLNKVIEKDPSNAQLYYAVGVCCDNIVNDTLTSQAEKDAAFTEAEKAYKKAIELKVGFFDAYYNFGALYVNKAAAIMQVAAKLPLSASKEYNEAKTMADELLKKALVYLEKAIEITNDDLGTLQSLKTIYTRLNMPEKLKAVNEKIATLTGKK